MSAPTPRNQSSDRKGMSVARTRIGAGTQRPHGHASVAVAHAAAFPYPREHGRPKPRPCHPMSLWCSGAAMDVLRDRSLTVAALFKIAAHKRVIPR